MPAPLDPSIVQQIWALRADCLSYQKIADTLNLNKKTVINYCNPISREKARNDASDYREKYPERVHNSSRRSYIKHKSKRRAGQRQYYYRNRAKILEQKRIYYNNNIDRLRQRNRDYYAVTQTRLVEYAREYRVTHKIEIARIKRKHYESNKHLYLARNAVRRARLLRATPVWLTSAQLLEMEDFFALSRQIREATGEVQHVDHIEPLVSKRNGTPVACGLHVPWNLAVVPAKYNLSKNCFV